MEPKVKPAFQLREYYPHEVCRIINRRQAFAYMQNNVWPCDIYLTADKQDTVYVFFKSETKDLYAKWLNKEL